MGLHLSRRGYAVRVDGMRAGDSRYVIRGEIAYAAHLSEDEWMQLSPMAQLDLLLAIEGEERRARQLGAERAHERVVGEELLTGTEVRPARAAASRRAGLFGDRHQ